MSDVKVDSQKEEFAVLPNKKCKVCYGRGFYIGNEIVDGSNSAIFKSEWTVNPKTEKKEKMIIESNMRKGINPCGCLTRTLKRENLNKFKPVYTVIDDVQFMVLVEKKETVKEEII